MGLWDRDVCEIFIAPDWAVVDMTKPGNNYKYLPLFVQSQGFFDETWRLKAVNSGS